VILSACISLFKLYALPYPKGQWEMDCPIFLITYVVLQVPRIKAGMQGNRIESRGSIIFMIVISAFSVFCNFFFIFLQTYT
jgi:hypothetical protein